ncbi:MAG: TPM domain-containing protein [Cyclobacteriaceae bacterium]
MTEIFNKEKQQIIEEAIKEAERATSGEIRLHVEEYCPANVLDRATEVFSSLEMQKTEERNGVLFYLALKDKQFAIIGDVGINRKMEDHYWGEIKDHLVSRFKNQEYVLGLKEAILMTGIQMKDVFPAPGREKNELLDDVSFGNNEHVVN